MPDMRRTALALAILILALALGACTRSASEPVATAATGGTSSAPSGQQATMEAVRSALLTQTAQAAAGKAVTNTPTPKASGATATPAAQTTPGTTPVATTAAVATAINVPATARPACPFKYIVQSGDRLFRIGLNLGYDADFWKQIASANGIVSPWLIYPGQELTIPCPE
jgi:hypothetical protein